MDPSPAPDMYDALLVDDEPVLRQAMARAFNRAGFRCELAGDGRHALQLLSERRFHIVVTDLRMPEMNGHRLAVELLQQPSRPVVIVVTGVTEQKLEADLRARGIDDILFKPVDYGQLSERARELVEERSHKLTEILPAEDNSAAISPTSERHSPEARDGTSIDAAIPFDNAITTVAPNSPPRRKREVSHVEPTAARSSAGAEERILRLERELANFKARQNLSSVMLTMTCIGSLVLGWLLAMISAWAV